jgi:hypothetical protein
MRRKWAGLTFFAVAGCFRIPQSTFPDSDASKAADGPDAGSRSGAGGGSGAGGVAGGAGGVAGGAGGGAGGAGETGGGGTTTCPKPSGGNLLANPGFDRDDGLLFWKTSEGASWSSDDADGCPQSGSAHSVVTAGTFDFGNVQQCVGIQAGVRYFFGYKFKEDVPGAGECRVRFFQGPDCSGNELDAVVVQTNGAPADLTWMSSPLAMAFAPQNATVANVICQINIESSILFDDLFLNPISPDF